MQRTVADVTRSMTHLASSPDVWRRIRQRMGIVLVLAASTGASFAGIRLMQGTLPAPVTAVAHVPESGLHLLVYAVISSQCAACRDEATKRAFTVLRDSLRTAHSGDFAKISVIAVDLDGVEQGLDYVKSYGPVFDEVSVGGAWLNQVITHVVWRDAWARAVVPQVIVVRRSVAAAHYPRDVQNGQDSLVLSVAGRDSILSWVASGVPLALRRTPKPPSNGVNPLLHRE